MPTLSNKALNQRSVVFKGSEKYMSTLVLKITNNLIVVVLTVYIHLFKKRVENLIYWASKPLILLILTF